MDLVWDMLVTPTSTLSYKLIMYIYIYIRVCVCVYVCAICRTRGGTAGGGENKLYTDISEGVCDQSPTDACDIPEYICKYLKVYTERSFL